MCGLFGIAGPLPTESRLQLEPALQALTSRGPDDHGFFADDHLRLIHTRLAIQDLSGLGHQPMQTLDGGLVLVFNGEIYNAPSLRESLKAEGEAFRSGSDTEVILLGYRRWGDAIWSQLDGIFACALWDRHQRLLTLARDPLGIKPLLWSETAEGLVFASELSAIVAAGCRAPIDAAALQGYALWGAFAQPQTILKDVHAFPPGAVGHWHPGGRVILGNLRGVPCPMPLSAPTVIPSTPQQAVEGVRERLHQAVLSQTIGDVPVGSFLSGGLDSGILTALLQDCRSEPVCTLSVGFLGVPGAVDETERAKATAEHLGTDHHAVQLGPAELDGLFDTFLEAIDQPSIDGFNTFVVAQAAHLLGLRVAFSGLGADEVFAGYGHFQQHHQAMAEPGPVWAGRLPVQVLRLAGWQLQAYRLRGLAAALDLRQIPFSGLPPSTIASLVASRLDRAEDLAGLELAGYLRDTLLRDTDAVTMHWGLEVRVPFLDQELVRYCLALPAAWHLADGPKTLLRQAFAERLPAGHSQMAKTGFNLPLGPWLLNHSRFHPARIAGLLKPLGISRRVVLASWLYCRLQPQRWQPYWRWVVLAEWCALNKRLA